MSQSRVRSQARRAKRRAKRPPAPGVRVEFDIEVESDELILDVPCPDCGVPAGEPCIDDRPTNDPASTDAGSTTEGVTK